MRPATLDEAEAFGIAPGAELFELRRVRMLDGLPISLDLNRVPLRLVPELVELDFTRASLYEALDRAGHPAARATTSSRPAAPRRRAAELLGLALGAPVLFATTVAFGEDGRVLDLGQTVYRADRYRFQATLTRRVQRERGSNEETLALAGRAGDRRRRVRRDAGGGEA